MKMLRNLSCNLVKGLHQRIGKGRVINVVGQALDTSFLSLIDRAFDGFEQGGVGTRIVIGTSWFPNQGKAALGKEKSHLAIHLVELVPNPFADLRRLLGRCPDQGDLGVVIIKFTSPVTFRHCIWSSEVYHLQGTACADLPDSKVW